MLFDLKERKQKIKEDPNYTFKPYTQFDIDNLYHDAGIRTEKKDYYHYLEKYITKDIYTPIEGKEQNIVLMGCGIAQEAAGVNSFFRGKEYGKLSDDVNVYGIDLDPMWLNIAAREHEKFPQFKFFCKNNQDLPNIKQIPKELDIVTFKNPLVQYYHVEDFTEMIDKAYNSLRKGGIIYSSFLFADDKKYFMEAMKNLGIEPIVNEGKTALIIKKQ